jgi:hypothetical protein
MKTLVAAAAVALAVASSGAASAQPRGPAPRGGQGPRITLYELPNFQGLSRTFTADVDNLADQGFNDRAQSLKVEGRWRICEDARLRGRCVEVSGDVPNLGDLRMTVQVSSFEDLGRDRRDRDDRFGRGPGGGFNGGFNPGGNAGRDFAGPAMDGRTVSFFPQPQPGPYRSADEFCRRLGFSGVVYADDRGPGLRDVVCRR